VIARESLLLLFDVDGTLVAGATRTHAEALRTALREVHGLDEIRSTRSLGIEPAGRTDPEIARLTLLAHDVSAARIDARAARVRAVTEEVYARTCPPDLSDTVLPGIPALLARLDERENVCAALLTGNYEGVARVKLRAAGIGHWFAPGEGAFGSDSEDRTDLPAIARARAGAATLHGAGGAAEGGSSDAGGVADHPPHPRERTVVIGDTPRDILCAHADEVRCLAVATGRFTVEQLREAGADWVAADAAEIGERIDALI
jgi:phosphoglycolate phosphatase-like HAD superfamily hydrolase